jgi:hypothetical protein
MAEIWIDPRTLAWSLFDDSLNGLDTGAVYVAARPKLGAALGDVETITLHEYIGREVDEIIAECEALAAEEE